MWSSQGFDGWQIAKAKHCPEKSSTTAIPVTGYSFAPNYPWTSWSPFSYDLGNSLGSCGVYVPHHHAWFHPHQASGPLPMYVGTNIHGSVPYCHHQTNASSSTIVSAMQDGSDEHEHPMHLVLNSNANSSFPSSDDQGKSHVQPTSSVSASAAEARKKRKELTKLKHLQGKQVSKHNWYPSKSWFMTRKVLICGRSWEHLFGAEFISLLVVCLSFQDELILIPVSVFLVVNYLLILWEMEIFPNQ